MLLSDMGASVIKVEPPNGDGLRQWPPLTEGFSENFASLNRNKKSIVLDLKNDEDNDIARRLVLDADVLIENNRPGVMERLGLGYPQFAAERPDLIYCSISAYGQTGPRADEGGFDLTIQAAAGVMSVTGESDGAPVKCGVPISDFASGLYAAFAVTSALVRVRAGGNGAHIDVPMFGCTLGIAALQTSEFFGTGLLPRRLGSAHPRNAPYQAYRAADGFFAIAAGNDGLWREVCRVVGRDYLVTDGRFLTTADRASNQHSLKELLEAVFETQPVDYWIGAFAKARVPHARINSYDAALGDPQTRHMGWIKELQLPGGRTTQTFASPLKFGGESFEIRSRPPLLGEHTKEFRDAYSRRQPDLNRVSTRSED
ncbi:CoA transferase [Bradyrhizobium guangdongense]|nr:CoA transferase [Bradyrhizobium guangdongense]